MEIDMNRDGYIKKKFKEDTYISEQANDVFENFKRGILLDSQNKAKSNNVINFSEEVNKRTDNNTNSEVGTKKNSGSVQNFKIDAETLFYKKINRVLGVAAVSLCAVVIGTGTVLYNRKSQVENIDIMTKSVSVSNEELKFSSEQVVKEHENNLVKASLIGSNEVAVQLKKDFIDKYKLNLSTEKQYKVYGINKGVIDVFVGNIINEYPYVMLLMEDNTVEYVPIVTDDKVIVNEYEFSFYSAGRILGLYDVIGFEQAKRNYSYSNDIYYYVNAVRKDGTRKEIEIGYYNDWEDSETRVFDKLNQEYIEKYESKQNNKNSENAEKRDDSEKKIVDENSNLAYKQKYQDKSVFKLNIDSTCAYFMQNSSLYKIDIESNTDRCIATGVTGYALDNRDGRLTAYLSKDYFIYEDDKNIIYNHKDVNASQDIVGVSINNKVRAEVRADGSMVLLIEIGGLESLGISKDETSIRENIRYNIYGEGEEVYNSVKSRFEAGATQCIVGNIGPEGHCSLVYRKNDDTIVCIDLIEAIKDSNLNKVKKVLTAVEGLQGFKKSGLHSTEGDVDAEEYATIWAIIRKDNGDIEYRDLYCDE